MRHPEADAVPDKRPIQTELAALTPRSTRRARSAASGRPVKARAP
jgi:hypothetical protein